MSFKDFHKTNERIKNREENNINMKHAYFAWDSLQDRFAAECEEFQQLRAVQLEHPLALKQQVG